MPELPEIRMECVGRAGTMQGNVPSMLFNDLNMQFIEKFNYQYNYLFLRKLIHRTSNLLANPLWRTVTAKWCLLDGWFFRRMRGELIDGRWSRRQATTGLLWLHHQAGGVSKV
ncbi:hypothetical protein [Chitinimonas sp. BJB300]|uniref:hypothetical protein n=1 Tax=Chitinimonas sp. BJB300 TaxID=1559339 RepID=UPI001111E00E|nr:hypothetical protein [Chitinimonas sp. BJB300]TSJ91394.1 hypothetical protein FG002_003670 [Chitinimonas sp. BJB300]